MEHHNNVLVVGATGLLGSEVVRILCEADYRPRVLLRATCPAGHVARLADLKVHTATGDLRDQPSLVSACRGIKTVISTATSMLSRQPGDSIESVDENGMLALIDAAETAGVEHFVYISFVPNTLNYAFQRAKRRVEARLQRGSMSFTILQPIAFCELWLSPMLGFDVVRKAARILGTGERPVSWISLRDVARFAAAAAAGGGFAGKVIPLGGPDALSQAQIVSIFEELGGPGWALERVSESVLEAQLAAATDPIQEAIAASMLVVARGQVVDPRPPLEQLPGRLISVRDIARNLLSQPH